MNICHLCLIKTDEEENINELLSLKIQNCVSINVFEGISVPPRICSSCLTKINNWYEFKEMCIKSHSYLVGFYKSNASMNTDNISKEDSLIFNSDDEVTEHFVCLNTDLKFETICYECVICMKQFDNCLEYLDHQSYHDGEPVFKCDHCSEVFTKRLDLVAHDKSHKIACNYCGKMIMKQSLKNHLIKHTDRFKCTNCLKYFSSQSILDQHIISVHTNIKNHTCDVCGKRFSCKVSLSVHLKIHSDQRQYPCKLCSYKAKTASSLYIHMSIHAEEDHVCEVCSKVFKSNRNLRDHLRRVHCKEKKHECKYCDKKFLESYMLKIHLRTHTGVRPYNCNLCDKAFNRVDSLKEHKLIHGDRVLHDCLKCSKKFTSKRGLTRHHCLKDEF